LHVERMRMLILVAGQPPAEVVARRGDYPRWIRARVGDAWSGDWAARDLRGDFRVLPGPRDADAFVITGSASSVTERAPWMRRAEELVRAIVHARRPLLGICFGHQMIAQALGGDVALNARGREIGTMPVRRVADDPIFAGLPRAFDVHGTHSDVVARLPAGAEVLATTPLDPVAAFRIGDRVRGVQFHPEFDADVMRGFLRIRSTAVRSEGGDPDALLAAVHDGARGRDILRNFARWARATPGGPGA
jgi:GMP synthase (glutamine-hydrolysing)